MTALDRDLLDAFVPEFEAEAVRLAMVREAAAGARALDQLRAMAAALGAPSLGVLVERAAALLEPLDLPALHKAAEVLAAQARAIGAAGADVALTAMEAGPPPQPSPARGEGAGGAGDTPSPLAGEGWGGGLAPSLDPDLLAAFLPEFDTLCARLAAAADPTAAQRVIASLDAMAASLELRSLTDLLRAAPLDPFDPAAFPPLAATLAKLARAIAEAGHDIPPAGAARARVLVVDDSPMMRRLVKEILAGDSAFEIVGEAADGRAALAAMRNLKPDLTMLDIEMPELDGLGVLRAWALRGPGAVVIVSSAARPGSAAAIEARALGAAGIVGKPSGALSPDLRQRQGEALLRTARRAAGLAA